MTTIACDGKTLVADGRATRGDAVVTDEIVKIYRLDDGSIFAACGSYKDNIAVRRWFNSGAKEDDIPKTDDRFAALRLSVDGIEVIEEGMSRYPVPAPVALGSGREFALGAMLAGADATKAVEIACTRDVFSGGQITAYHL